MSQIEIAQVKPAALIGGSPAPTESSSISVSPWRIALLTLVFGLVTTVITITGNLIQTYITNSASMQASNQARQSSETTLMLRVLAFHDAQERCAGLHFLVTAGLIHDPGGKIMKLTSDQIPEFPKASGPMVDLSRPAATQSNAPLLPR